MSRKLAAKAAAGDVIVFNGGPWVVVSVHPFRFMGNPIPYGAVLGIQPRSWAPFEKTEWVIFVSADADTEVEVIEA